MNRIMLLGLLVCISRVALCGVMGVMAETAARRAGSSSLRGLCRLCVVAYALVLAASFAPMDSAQTVAIGPSRCFSSSRIFSSGSRCCPPARPCAARAGGTIQTAPPIR